MSPTWSKSLTSDRHIPAPKEIKQVNDEWRSLQLWFSTKGDIDRVAKKMDVPVAVAEVRIRNALERYDARWVKDIRALKVRQAFELREYMDMLREQAEGGSVPAIAEIRQLMAAERKLVGLEEERQQAPTVVIDKAIIQLAQNQITSPQDAETLERLARVARRELEA